MRTRSRARLLVASTTALVLIGGLLPSSASAYWSVSTSAPSSGAASASTVNPGPTPAATVATQNDITVGWSASTLSSGQTVTGYTVTRYSATNVPTPATGACAGVITGTSCLELNVPEGSWTYTVTARYAVNWVGLESARSAAVRSDTTAPENSIFVLLASGGAVRNATGNVFYRGAAPGSFRFRNVLTDTGSGAASSATSAFTGTATGWTHSPSSVATPAGGPFDSALFTWATGTSTEPTVNVVGSDTNGNTASTTIQFRLDNTPPTGGAISYTGGTIRTTTLPITVQAIADAGAGTGGGYRFIERRTATLTGDTCSAFGGYANARTNPPTAPTTPHSDSVVVNACYQYRYRFSDSVGNETIVESPNIVKVKPAYATVIAQTPGLVDYYRLGEPLFAGAMIDAQGANNNGTYLNFPLGGQGGAIAGDSNTAVVFTTDTDYVSIPRNISGNFSIELWFKSTAGIGTGTQWYTGAGLVDGDVAGLANDFGISLGADGRVRAGVGNPDTTIASQAGLNNNVWHHVVMTRQQFTGTIVLYIDGAAVATAAGGTQLLNAPANIHFGQLQTGLNQYAGSLDEVAFYNSTLSAAQVQSHYLNALR